MLPVLYSFRRCPYAMRARMALVYSGIKHQHREILLKNKPASMLKYSTKGTVPVLITADKVIDESLDIMYWALLQNDPDNWLANDDQYDLIKICDEEFKPQLDKYKYSDRYDLTENQYRDQALWFLSLLNQQLAENRQLMSKKLSMADIAIFPFLRQFAFVNKQWFDNNGFNCLQNWLESHLQSKLFISIMQKHQLWKDR